MWLSVMNEQRLGLRIIIMPFHVSGYIIEIPEPAISANMELFRAILKISDTSKKVVYFSFFIKKRVKNEYICLWPR
jgi:hypothetical protein